MFRAYGWVCGLLVGIMAAGCGGGDGGATEKPPRALNQPRRAYLNMPATGAGAVPKLLSQTGAFADVRSLAPAAGLLPYALNAPFWSDGADKQRWMAAPPAGKIEFAPTGEWKFPAGTVFVKHFERDNRRLETRLLVVVAGGGVYGASYKWRPDGSDAELVTDGFAEVLSASSDGGERRWYFPGRADCLVCHTPAAGGVLGVTTRQMNRAFAYPDLGGENQLIAWSRRGLFARAVEHEELGRLPRLVAVGDSSESLERRARSFLDANCAQCHRPGGVAGNFDARWETPLEKQNLVDGPVLIDMGLDRARVIAPRDPWRSVALARVSTMEKSKMPPLAHEVVDRAGVEVLKAWIESLPGMAVLAPPSMSPAGGEFKASVKVVMTHADPRAQIRYTLDGSVPTKASAVYSGPIEVTGPATVRARVFEEGFTRSVVVQETYVVGD